MVCSPATGSCFSVKCLPKTYMLRHPQVLPRMRRTCDKEQWGESQAELLHPTHSGATTPKEGSPLSHTRRKGILQDCWVLVPLLLASSHHCCHSPLLLIGERGLSLGQSNTLPTSLLLGAVRFLPSARAGTCDRKGGKPHGYRAVDSRCSLCARYDL